ncbi:LacI family DNA-binding transcriptional regulator [Dactylosporangium matsuzakiense]|uniref:LacI family transcriptional regulator n=1 Tax=Dactylosporangium matsuzakiense TaxID=53360 RepID=A0A9W6KN12_9ACTN|nr:LacI family DNA-binding transcriptional regulator [Dactylosporangium matsuzakiense]UWZ41902.1 LacI family DNA-binding transcriptional regulator [Dactylosporangium matsuzakiense]GLL04433.1 LacI family transcriptional regulator [Dactylosporangium matsuzakiense]
MPPTKRRLTQRDIARMTGVSQATVSLVLNGRSDGDVRIAPETRERVLQAIRDSGYVADPIARRLAARDNRIIGVFTYEPVFPAGNSDFYHPFLVGIEERAEALGSDLLLLTSAPVVDGRRRIFHEGNRLRLADGCILLGRSLDRDELARLVADGFPFVSVGRRDDAGGPVPYVGADYAGATAALVRRAVGLGHTRLLYMGQGEGPESHADRKAGFDRAVAAAGVTGLHLPADDLGAVLGSGATAVFAEEHSDGVALHARAASTPSGETSDGPGPEAPGTSPSIITLGQPTRPVNAPGDHDTEFTGFEIPRREMGAQALEVLTALIDGARTQIQRLLPCALVPGTTLRKVEP